MLNKFNYEKYTNIFLYGISLFLTFNAATVNSAQHYSINNLQMVSIPNQEYSKNNKLSQNISNQTGLIKQQNVVNHQNSSIQPTLINQQSQQNNINSVPNNKQEQQNNNNDSNSTKRYNNLTLEQQISFTLKKLSDMEDYIKSIDNKITKQQEQIKEQQKQESAEINKALKNFYNSEMRAVRLQDGTTKIVSVHDIDPDKLCKNSSKQQSVYDPTMVPTNIIYPLSV